MDIQKRFHRTVQAIDQCDRRGDRTDGEPRIHTGYNEPPACEIDQQRTDLGKHTHYDAKPLAAALFLQL